jgi:ribosomal protein S24E
MEVQEDFKNSLIGRREIVAVAESSGNPGFTTVKEDLVKELGVDENLVIVKKVGSKFGRGSFEVEAFVYDSQESKEKVEGKDKEPEKTEESSESADAAPAPKAAPAEAPKEESKAEEAPKEEEKKEESKEDGKVEASE